ncbi:MAG: outer membrane beta-barrel protein [Luteitalea sp.]|nr:outer membrane beta-barrel protein [Luteitalea sp.]
MSRLLGTMITLSLVMVPTAAHAQLWLTPFAGVGTTGDLTAATVGVSVAGGGVVSGELDLGFTPGQGLDGIPLLDIDASMTTIMGNLLVRAPTGNVQPYGSGGIGLMRLSLSADVPILGDIGLGSVHSNELAWNAGGGAVFFAGDRVGIRGDVRYFRAFDTTLNLSDFTDFDIDDIPLPGFDFWRLTGGVTFRF